jgi:hypothetical protein
MGRRGFDRMRSRRAAATIAAASAAGQARTASGTGIGGSGWYGGMADVTIYTGNSSDASYIGTSCGYEVNGNTTQLPYEQGLGW